MTNFLISTLLSAAFVSAQGTQSMPPFSAVSARITNIPAGYCDAMMVQILPGESYSYEAEPSGLIRGSIQTKYDLQWLVFAMTEGKTPEDWSGGVTVTVWMPRDALRVVDVAQKNSLRVGGPAANGTFTSTGFVFNAQDEGQLLVEDLCGSISSANFNSGSHSQIALTDECGDIHIESLSVNSGAWVAITSDAMVHGSSWGANSGAHVSVEGALGSTVSQVNINSGAWFLMKGVTVSSLNANSGAHWSTVDGSVQNQNVNSGAGPVYTFDAVTSVSLDSLAPHPNNVDCPIDYAQWVAANLWWIILVLVVAVLLACICLCTCICLCCRNRRAAQPLPTTIVYAATPEVAQQAAAGAPKYDGAAATMV